MPKHSLRGVPDIILIKRPTGRFVGLEVNRKDGRLSPDQKTFEVRATQAGGEYHVVQSIDDVQRLGF